ncbi:prepilin peptidase [Candidatus Gottesmanbacteria bacterium]|nr:prepilin peptidase [Candidatus Gottesmanbacteria bacterium]
MEIFIFLFGLCIGSFANVLIDRLPRGEDIFRGRSRCDYCKKELRWFELIPVISFFIQRGRCRRCHRQLSIQYPLVELASAVAFVFLFPHIPSLLIFLSLLVIFVADLKYEIIPDSMIILGLIGGLIGKFSILSAIGAAAFFLFLFLVTRGRGMGLGDVKLAFLLGLILGFPTIVIALYTAFLTGAAVGIILMIGGKKTLKSHVPFGPFLILGAMFAMLYGNGVMEWWNKFL